MTDACIQIPTAIEETSHSTTYMYVPVIRLGLDCATPAALGAASCRSYLDSFFVQGCQLGQVGVAV